MTHLAADVRADSTGFLAWILNIAGDEAVSSSSSWVKTTKCFIALLGWDGDIGTLGRTGKATFGQAGGDNKTMVKHLQVFTQFLSVGLLTPVDITGSGGMRDSESTQYQNLISTNLLLPHPTTLQHLLPRTSDCYAYLNLFTTVTTSLGMETLGTADDCEGRRRQFRPYVKVVERGLENARKEGGLLGRAASAAHKVLERGMAAGDGVEDDGDGGEG
jgi:pre-rRNA-processing protein IPI1